MAKIIYTCNNCGFDNPEDSSKCNKCGTSLVVIVKGGLFSSDTYRYNYTKRWVCARCGAKNISGNDKCHGCSSKSGTGSFDLF